MSFEKSGVLEFLVVVVWSMGGRWMVDGGWTHNFLCVVKKSGNRWIPEKTHNFWIEGSIDGFWSIDGF
jgi:hypothetical protein